ncbi:MAG: hypothetical protein MUC36_06210 [Planctomycetes bacterium]|jgi:hypothetical protein|nr:hypothetical protein [Planctomycetota bacterium]
MIRCSSFLFRILPIGIAAAMAVPVLAQVRVMERAAWPGVGSLFTPIGNYFAWGGWHDATRNLLVLGSGAPDLKEWDGPGAARSATLPYTGGGSFQGLNVCEFPLTPGAGLVWNPVNGTWRYSGGTWTQLGPAFAPPITCVGPLDRGMVWDAARSRALLLFTQFCSSTPLVCHEFDGSAWTALPVPPATVQCGLVYDEARGRVLALTNAGAFTFTGSQWVAAADIPGPTAIGRAMAWDAARQRIVAFGGRLEDLSFVADTWEWDGTQWTLRTPTTSPTDRGWSTMIYDRQRQRCVLFGGRVNTPSGISVTDEVWAWDGTNWQNWSASTVRPPARNDAMLAEDESRGSVLFGGRDANGAPLGDTWIWNGDAWGASLSVQNPLPRSAGGMVRSGFNSTLLFGGMDGNGNALGDTWTFAGGWQLRAPAFSPSPRLNHAMASAVTDNSRVWLFGGTNGTTWFNDLWHFSDANPTWILTNTQPSPPARDIHAMAFDELRNRLVVFGGRSASGQALDDTWEYDIANNLWSLRNPPTRPQARFNAAMVYDPLKGRTMLLGGYDPNAGTFLQDLHEWDGTRWTLITPETSGVRRTENLAACYDRYTNRAVFFGGQTDFSTPVSDTTWELQEHLGRSALAQGHSINLAVTGRPVVGGLQTPLRVEIPSTSQVSLLLLELGPRPQPLVTGLPPLFCSPQDLHVQGLLSMFAIGNPGQYSLPLPAAAAGYLITFQGVSISASGCFETTASHFVRVRSM